MILNLLETFRTKEELINYFEENGESITEEEIEALKKSYEQTETNSNTLAMQQLDEVAGGWFEWRSLLHTAGKVITGLLAVQTAVHQPVPEALKDHATGSEICVTKDDGKHCFGTVRNLDPTSAFSDCIPQGKGDYYHLLCFDPNYLESHPGSTCAPRVGYNYVFDKNGNRLTTPLEPIPLDCKEKGTPTVDREPIAEVHDYPYLQVVEM